MFVIAKCNDRFYLWTRFLEPWNFRIKEKKKKKKSEVEVKFLLNLFIKFCEKQQSGNFEESIFYVKVRKYFSFARIQ